MMNSKGERAVKVKTGEKFFCMLAGIISLSLAFFIASPSYAEMKTMTDRELKNETAQAGLASFSRSENTIRMFMDIHLETYTTVDSMKTGYYSRDAGVSAGWDQDWQKVNIGTSVTDPMKMDGFVFKADFNENLDTSTTRPTLKRLVIGTNRLVGTMTAENIASFTGIYNPLLSPASTQGGAVLTRTPLGKTSFGFASPSEETDANRKDNQGFFIVIAPEGDRSGIQVVAGYNELSISDGAFNTTDWWDR